MLEDAGLAVDVGDRRAARGGVGEGRVVGHQPEVVLVDLDLPQVHRLDGAVGDLELVALAGAVVGDAERVVAARAVALASSARLFSVFAFCLVAMRLQSYGVLGQSKRGPRSGASNWVIPLSSPQARLDLPAVSPRPARCRSPRR